MSILFSAIRMSFSPISKKARKQENLEKVDGGKMTIDRANKYYIHYLYPQPVNIWDVKHDNDILSQESKNFDEIDMKELLRFNNISNFCYGKIEDTLHRGRACPIELSQEEVFEKLKEEHDTGRGSILVINQNLLESYNESLIIDIRKDNLFDLVTKIMLLLSYVESPITITHHRWSATSKRYEEYKLNKIYSLADLRCEIMNSIKSISQFSYNDHCELVATCADLKGDYSQYISISIEGTTPDLNTKITKRIASGVEAEDEEAKRIENLRNYLNTESLCELSLRELIEQKLFPKK